MSAERTNAFFVSAGIHLLLAGLLIWFTYAAGKSEKETVKVFELVAGAGDNFAATEAPALGTPGGNPSVKIEIPEPPSPSPIMAAPEPPAPEPPAASPVIEAVAEPTPPKPAPKTPEYKPVNLAKTVTRIADKRAANIEKKFKKEQEQKRAADERAAKEAAINAKRMTKADFDKMNKGKSSPSQTASRNTATGGGTGAVKRIDSEGIAGGVVGGSTANKVGGAGGKALTRQDIELSDAYISLLIQRLKEAHRKPDGLSDLLQATVQFRLTSSGSVTNVTIVSSSRNNEYDQSVLAAFRRISLPPPPLNLKTNDYTITFKMKEDV